MNIERKFNSDTGKTSWTFSAWYFKVYFVVGMLYCWFLILAFFTGLIIGFTS